MSAAADFLSPGLPLRVMEPKSAGHPRTRQVRSRREVARGVVDGEERQIVVKRLAGSVQPPDHLAEELVVVAAPPRCFEPRIFRAFIQVLDVGPGADGVGTQFEVGFRFSIPWM